MKPFFPLVLLMAATMLAMGQSQHYRSGVLVLRDGRIIAIRGEYEVFTDEVHFTDGNGQLMSLPLDRVDLAETDRRNEALRGDGTQRTGEPHLVDQVEAYRGKVKEGNGGGVEVVIPHRPETGDAAQGSSSSTPEISLPTGWREILDADPRQMERIVQRCIDRFTKIHVGIKALLLMLIVLALLLGLLSFGLQCYVVFKAFGDSILWGLGLVLAFVAPIVLATANTFIGGPMFGLKLLAQLGAPVIGLFFPLLMLIYILIYRYGSRLKLVLWIWVVPLVCQLAFLAVVIYAFAPVFSNL